MSARDIYAVALNQGFKGNAAVTAVAVALAESGGNPNATHRNTNGSTDYGLWQINSVHADLLRGHQWANPTENARMAYVISSGGRNWTPWTTYTSGRYRAFVGQARAAAQGRDATSPGGGTTTPQSGAAGTGGGGSAQPASLSMGGAIDALTSPATWLRVAMIIGGLLLLLVVIATAMGRDILSVRRKVLG